MSTIDLCRIYVDGSILQYDEQSELHHVRKKRALFRNGNMLPNENKIFMTHLFSSYLYIMSPQYQLLIITQLYFV